MTGEWQRASDLVDGEELERQETARKLIPLPCEFLNDALTGIAPNDLVLLGARTGDGKTYMAVSIMLECCRRGLRVGFMSLESEPREIQRRTKFQVLSNLFYSSPDRPAGKYLRYQEWRYGLQDKLAFPWNAMANLETKRQLANAYTLYRKTGSFTVKTFVEKFDQIKDKVDLIIVDHLHYFDHDSDDDNRGVKHIIQTIRDTSLIAGKPVVLLAHVRKSDKPRFMPLVPSIDDIHGSSDISKNCTKVIMTAPAHGVKSEPFIRPTYMAASKCRTDGSVVRYAALCWSDDRTGRFSTDYEMGKFTEHGTMFTHLTGEEMPRWARHGRPGNGNSEAEETEK